MNRRVVLTSVVRMLRGIETDIEAECLAGAEPSDEVRAWHREIRDVRMRMEELADRIEDRAPTAAARRRGVR